MKRMTLTIGTAAIMLAAALPAAAVAEGHHHRGHHRRHIHVRSFGTRNPSAPASASAGTVASFSGGVLTIKLTGGGTVVGKVTPATELKCESAGASRVARMADHGGDDGGNGAGRGGPGPGDERPAAPGTQAGDDNNENDVNDVNDNEVNDNEVNDANDNDADDNGANDARGAACDIGSLKEGTTVRSAELVVNSAGATFTEVEILS